MERAKNLSLHRGPDGSVHTILLEADFVGQHQAGIDELQHLLTIQLSEATGIEQRSMTRPLASSAAVRLFEDKVTERFWPSNGKKSRQKTSAVSVLAVNPYHAIYSDRSADWVLKAVGQRWKEETPAVASWGREGFTIVGYTDEVKFVLGEFAAAIGRSDFAVWSGRFSENPFDPGGLVLCIPSRAPEHLKQQLLETDLERNRLQTAATATGIAERLAAAEKASSSGWGFSPYRYHALSPHWHDGFYPQGQTIETEHPVVFFLNPGDQASLNFGFFSVEQLDQWIAGNGPVFKRATEPEATPSR